MQRYSKAPKYLISPRALLMALGFVLWLAWPLQAQPEQQEAQPPELTPEPDAAPPAVEQEAGLEQQPQETPQTGQSAKEDESETEAAAEERLADDSSVASEQQEDEWDDFEEDFGDGQAGGVEQPMGGISLDVHGFVESLTAGRVVNHDSTSNDFVSNEARFRLSIDVEHELASARFRGDFVVDEIQREVYIDIRDASIYTKLAPWLSLRAGRQVLTWGTGDFVFLNDLFAKDFVSFFSGRRDEYLKAPSNSLRLSTNFNALNFDLVWTPTFTGDRFISGNRYAFFNLMTGGITGPGDPSLPLEPLRPQGEWENGEFHGRIFSSFSGIELALYGYLGFWKQPNALDLAAMVPSYARLAVYGASMRTPLFGGLLNIENAFYHSFDDNKGDDPATPNSQLRVLGGYEHELFSKFNAGVQYYLEYTLEHDDLIQNSLWATYEQDELRHLVTLRLTYLLLQDNLELSTFAFFSPSDMDSYIRPRISYKWNDQLSTALGANIMVGKDDFTFFGQLEQNSNVYANLRYSF